MSNLHVASATDVSITTTAETTIATLNPFKVNAGVNGLGVLLRLIANITFSASTTARTLKVYRTIAGVETLVHTSDATTTTASTTADVPYAFLDDTVTALDGVSYRVTITLAGAASTSTVNYATLSAESANAVE